MTLSTKTLARVISSCLSASVSNAQSRAFVAVRNGFERFNPFWCFALLRLAFRHHDIVASVTVLSVLGVTVWPSLPKIAKEEFKKQRIFKKKEDV